MIAVFAAIVSYGQEIYPARVITGPNFAGDLFHSNTTQQMVKNKVQHLHSLDVKFGLANWYWRTNPTVASATTSINVDLDIDYVGFVMNLPNGGQRRVTLDEAGIRAPGYNISGIAVDIEFGKIGARATATFNAQGDYQKVSRNYGSIKFNSDQDRDKFNKFIKDNKLGTVKDIFSALDPQVSISNMGKWAEYSFVLGAINSYIEKVWTEGSLKIKLDNLLADARNAESFGRIDEAIEKYEEAYKAKQDPEIKAKIDELKRKKKEQENERVSNVQNNQQQEGNDETFDTTAGNSVQSGQEQDNKVATAQNNSNGQVELDFWGNPIAKKTTDGKAETVTYGGTEVQDNELYRSQMALREQNANTARVRQTERAAERQRVDQHNDAIFEQAQQGIEQTNRDIAEMDKAIGQLDYSSGKGLLESSGNLARAATATGNVGQAKGALIGMGVGAVMAIGEGAAKRRAAREAREEREKLEKERTAALKKALRNARTSVFRYFEAGELPMSSTKSRGNNLYYFVYAADDSQVEENTCKVYVSNVFAVGRYPDGTWPMKNRIEQELNALTPLQEVIHGPYASLEEAQSSRRQFGSYAEKARMEVVALEHKGFNVQVEGSSRTSVGPALDFFGNPINPKKEAPTKQLQKKNTAPQKAQATELDFWGNPIKR